MKSIKEFSKEWCCEHSNKGCKEQCDGCWQIKSAWGCEQHNMELACETGANYVLEHLSMTIAVSEDNYLRDNLKIMIEQLKK